MRVSNQHHEGFLIRSFQQEDQDDVLRIWRQGWDDTANHGMESRQISVITFPIKLLVAAVASYLGYRKWQGVGIGVGVLAWFSTHWLLSFLWRRRIQSIKVKKSEMDDIYSAFLSKEAEEKYGTSHFWTVVSSKTNRIVACGAARTRSKGSKSLEIMRVSVAPEARRHRVGSQLMEHIEHWARQQNFSQLETRVQSIHLLSLFTRNLDNHLKEGTLAQSW